jgi:hypothetical protein
MVERFSTSFWPEAGVIVRSEAVPILHVTMHPKDYVGRGGVTMQKHVA